MRCVFFWHFYGLRFIKDEYVSKRCGLNNPDIKHNMIKLNDLKDEINIKFALNMTTTTFHTSLKCDIPIIKTLIY